MVHLGWTDINFDLRVVRVTAKPALAFYPKRWEEREVPITVQLAELLRSHPSAPTASLSFRHGRGTVSNTCWIDARRLPPGRNSTLAGSI